MLTAEVFLVFYIRRYAHVQAISRQLNKMYQKIVTEFLHSFEQQHKKNIDKSGSPAQAV